MYQTVGHELIPAIASALEVPLHRRVIEGKSLEIGSAYSPTAGDEVEDLTKLLQAVVEAHPTVR